MKRKSSKKDNDDNGSYFSAAGRTRKKKRKKMMIIGITIIIAVAAGVAAAALLYKPTPVQAIDGVECHGSESLDYHHHAHLSVFVNGQEQHVPAGIGILPAPYSCLYWLHTHADDGIIHIEAPQAMTFTLGQFIDIWKQTKSDSQSFFSTISGMPVKVYVAERNNEQPQEFNGNPRDIELKSQEQIVLAYGSSQPATIPSYDFKGLT